MWQVWITFNLTVNMQETFPAIWLVVCCLFRWRTWCTRLPVWWRVPGPTPPSPPCSQVGIRSFRTSIVDLALFLCQCGSRSGSREPNQCGSGSGSWSQKVKILHEKHVLYGGNWSINIPTKVQKPFWMEDIMFILNFVKFELLMLLDPDPQFQYGIWAFLSLYLEVGIRIRIKVKGRIRHFLQCILSYLCCY